MHNSTFNVTSQKGKQNRVSHVIFPHVAYAGTRLLQGGVTGSGARGAAHLRKVGDTVVRLWLGCEFTRLAATPNECSNVSVMVL
jgi:hypothetical protein